MMVAIGFSVCLSAPTGEQWQISFKSLHAHAQPHALSHACPVLFSTRANRNTNTRVRGKLQWDSYVGACLAYRENRTSLGQLIDPSIIEQMKQLSVSLSLF